MTVILLIRHGHCTSLGEWLAGRTPGIHLSATGTRQAAQLAQLLAGAQLDAVYASPRERTQETAAPIAAMQGLRVNTVAEFEEVDFGEWTGKTFAELREDERWAHWNSCRSIARAPGGEAMSEVQARAGAALETIRAAHPDGTVAVVSHADTIRAVLGSLFSIPLEDCIKLVVSPASVSTVRVWDSWAELVALNWVGETPTK